MKPHSIVPAVFLSLLLCASNATASGKHPLEGCYSMISNDGEEMAGLVVLEIREKIYLIPNFEKFSYANALEAVGQATDVELEGLRGRAMNKGQFFMHFDLKADDLENIESSLITPKRESDQSLLFKVKPGKRVAQLESSSSAKLTKRTDYFAVIMTYAMGWVTKVDCR